ncbi:MAG: TRAP transporter TatT component family protein [Acidobacteriota bacterium]
MGHAEMATRLHPSATSLVRYGWAATIFATCALQGCSVRQLAIRSLGDALAAGASTYARDDDPELVRDALPFALKTIEGVLTESPRHRGLLEAAASGFTQYAYAFVECEADFSEHADLARATELRQRARKLYLRAREYGSRGIEVGHPAFRRLLQGDREQALMQVRKEEVGLLYWTAAAWAATISISKEDSELTADLSVVEAMMERALVLDEGYGGGVIHDFFIAYEGGRPASAGGSVDRAREHLQKATALSKGHRAAPLVTYAETVCVGTQDRVEFQRLLNEALTLDVQLDPDQRLANLIAQKRARWLLSCADELFVE